MECLFHNNEDKKREESFKMQYLKLFDWIESLVSAKLKRISCYSLPNNFTIFAIFPWNVCFKIIKMKNKNKFLVCLRSKIIWFGRKFRFKFDSSIDSKKNNSSSNSLNNFTIFVSCSWNVYFARRIFRWNRKKINL